MGRIDAAAARRARLWTGAASVCGALALTAALAALPWTSRWSARVDAVVFDAQVRWIRLRGAPATFRFEPDIAIVGVDAASLHAIDIDGVARRAPVRAQALPTFVEVVARRASSRTRRRCVRSSAPVSFGRRRAGSRSRSRSLSR